MTRAELNPCMAGMHDKSQINNNTILYISAAVVCECVYQSLHYSSIQRASPLTRFQHLPSSMALDTWHTHIRHLQGIEQLTWTFDLWDN